MISSYFCSSRNYSLESIVSNSLKLKSCQFARFPPITRRVSDFAKIIWFHPPIVPARSDLGDQSLAKAFLALLR